MYKTDSKELYHNETSTNFSSQGCGNGKTVKGGGDDYKALKKIGDMKSGALVKRYRGELVLNMIKVQYIKVSVEIFF